jgi:hypothetical protein
MSRDRERSNTTDEIDSPLVRPIPDLWPGKRTRTAAAIQLKADGATRSATELAAPPASGGSPLPTAVRTKMEASFGADFSNVRIHEDNRADNFGARAYAQGDNVHMAPGQYDPAGARGQELIGHELTHVVQQRQGRVAGAQGKDATVVRDEALENEADTQGALAARGQPTGMTGGASGGGAAVQLKTVVQLDGPPIRAVAASHTFAVPTVTDLNTLPDPTSRNHVINQTYHMIDTAMSGYLGDPLVSNWFTFGQHASREAGTQIRNLQGGLAVLRDSLTLLTSLTFGGGPMQTLHDVRLAVRTIQRIMDLMGQDAMLDQAMRLAMMRAGIDPSEISQLLAEAAVALAVAPNAALNPVLIVAAVPFIAHVTSVVARLIVAIPAIIRSVELIYGNMATGNRQIYENVAPAARSFLQLCQAAPDGLPAQSFNFAGDTNGFLAAAFAEYVEVRRLGDEARAAPGTPESTQKLTLRRQKAAHANLLVGMQEQLIILQPLFDTMVAELTAMNGSMVLHDPNGVHPLANNWANFYARMGIDPTTAPPNPRDIRPDHMPALLPAGRRDGTIGTYFEDNVDGTTATGEHIHDAPGAIAPM